MKRVKCLALALVVLLAVLAACEQGPRQTTTYALGESVTNVKDSAKLHLKSALVLTVYKDIPTTQFDDNLSAMRDAVITLLHSQDEDALRAADVLAALKLEIVEALNLVMGEEAVVGVFFDEFYLA